jgi:hypothetical protein
VWKALSEPAELIKWFPLAARVTPGEHGKIFVSWGPDCEGEAEIVAWEPNRRLAWEQGFAVIEVVLEARGSKTVVTLVQSGFLGNEDWENEWFESTDYGWGFILLSLRWIFERHPGVARRMAWYRVQTQLSREAAYAKILSENRIFAENAQLQLTAGNLFLLHTTVDGEYSRKNGICAARPGSLSFGEGTQRRAFLDDDRGNAGKN